MRFTDNISQQMDNMAFKLRPYVLFTALNTVWRNLDKRNKSILDVGCGFGQPMSFLNRHKQFFVVGADIFKPYLMKCREQGNHDNLVMCDVRHLPFKDKSFDAVVSMELLEHLEKDEGDKLLRDFEAISRHQIIISTPVGKYEQHTYHDNPYQEHRCIRTPSQFTQLGYQVRGHGLPYFGGVGGIASRLPTIIRPLHRLLWILPGPLVHFVPKISGDMVCIKKLQNY